MCNIYSITRNQEAIRRLFQVTRDLTDNLPALPAVYPGNAPSRPKVTHWFALDECRPLFAFAGIWRPGLARGKTRLASISSSRS
jgi:putative SOS response-associated peptidase YedK